MTFYFKIISDSQEVSSIVLRDLFPPMAISYMVALQQKQESDFGSMCVQSCTLFYYISIQA
jgi:hypothetical protein